jgi:hypothetical protein
MRDYYFSIAGQFTLALRSDVSFDDPQTLTKLRSFLPDCAPIQDYSRRHDVLVEHFNGAATALEVRPRHVMLTTPAAPAIPEDVFHLLYGVVRKEMIEQQGLYTIHATGVLDDQGCRLLTGHSGAGKTTMAQHMVDSSAARLVAANKAVLRLDEESGTMHVVGGTKTMTALNEQGARFSYVLPQHKVASKMPKPSVTHIDLISLNDGAALCETLSTPSALHTLYPLILDQVNADVILGENIIYDGSIAAQTKQKLIPQLRAALDQIRVRKITGSKSFIARHLAS